MSDDPIGESLGLPPIEPSKAVQKIIDDANSDNAAKDFEIARVNIHYMMDVAREAITNLNDIASQSQHPRAYEVLGKLIDTSVNTSKSLLDLQEKIRSIDSIENNINDNSKTINNNNLFVGSTKELGELIKKMKNGE